MATRNGAPYLSEQLDSFMSQTRLPDELIVSDDASSDSTRELVRAFAVDAPFPVTLKTNSLPLGYARNFAQAMSACSGDLIFLSDQDDVWFDNKIKTMLEHARAKQNTMCFMNDALLTDANLNPSKVSKMEQIRAAGLTETAFVMGCCVTVRRSCLDLVLPLPNTLNSHDNWLVGLADHLELIYRTNEVLQYYRRHGSNVSNFYVNESRKINRARTSIEYLKELPRRLGSGDSLVQERQFYSLLIDRIKSKHGFCEEHVGAKRLDEITNQLDTYLELLATRQGIRNLPYMKRLFPVFSGWRNGNYSRSGGTLGALKDLMFSSARK